MARPTHHRTRPSTGNHPHHPHQPPPPGRNRTHHRPRSPLRLPPPPRDEQHTSGTAALASLLPAAREKRPPGHTNATAPTQHHTSDTPPGSSHLLRAPVSVRSSGQKVRAAPHPASPHLNRFTRHTSPTGPSSGPVSRVRLRQTRGSTGQPPTTADHPASATRLNVFAQEYFRA